MAEDMTCQPAGAEAYRLIFRRVVILSGFSS
jgi:hypothetical protein